MDEAIASYHDVPLPTHTSEAQIRLQQHEEEKRYITELYTTAARKGDEVIAKIRQSVSSEYCNSMARYKVSYEDLRSHMKIFSTLSDYPLQNSFFYPQHFLLFHPSVI